MAFGCCWFGKSRKKSLVAVEEDAEPDFDLGQLERFSFQELRIATDGFGSKNLLARGSQGNIYKGRLEDGSLVAIKRLIKGQSRMELEFQREVKVTGTTAHPNVIRLCGVCVTSREALLVYPFMVNGKVASWLADQPQCHPPLDWPMRKHIALDTARGISYLHHSNPKIVHRNIKAGVVFLDEEFRGVVGGLGLAKLLHSGIDDAETVICGTVGYIAPEYMRTGRCSIKTDVYAYGMLLLEIVTGQTPYYLSWLANDDDLMLLDRVKRLMKDDKLEMLIDPDLHGDYVEAEVEELFQIALLCTQTSPEGRPTMSEVVRLLEGDGLAERWNEYRKTDDQLDSSPRHHPEWSFGSAEVFCAEDLPAPR